LSKSQIGIAFVPDLEYNHTCKDVMQMLAYITANEAAEKWNISHRRVLTLCKEKRINDVAMLGNMWIIPANAQKPEDARRRRYVEKKEKAVKPFLKWAGGKGQLLHEIQKYYPFGEQITKYAEPFVGGGAVLFDILGKFDLKEIYISDINTELMNVYLMIRDNVDEVIKKLQVLQEEFLSLDIGERKRKYTEIRERFNSLKANGDEKESIEKAAIMIFLNKTCFNGLYRVNKRGQFNVPIGSYKSPLICDEENLRMVSKRLCGVTIVCGDYRKAANFIDEKTFVYFDPPYRPLTKTSGFTAYNEELFDDKEQIELAEFVKKMDEKGARILISNSDPKNTDLEDNFFDNIYSKYKIRRVQANRMINSKASSRGKINELLISNF